ncbi:MAG: hypothetical protein C5B51_19695 [Terriglobia bacterium]|nr:MAG: hypothetical protein C5B51_19695 [Terriglobia bacterium]
MLSRRSIVPGFNLDDNVEVVVTLLRKHASVPMSLADACLVRRVEFQSCLGSQSVGGPSRTQTPTNRIVNRSRSVTLVPR